MKNNLLQKILVSLLFLMGSFSFSQNIEVIYHAKFVGVPSLSIEDMKPEEVRLANTIGKKLINTVEKQKIILISNQNSFILKVEEQMDIDVESMSSIIGRSVLNLYSYIYADDEVSSYGYDLGLENIVRFSNDSVSWEITGESKEILGFNCFKAIPNYKNFTEDQKRGLPTAAWFTPEINKKGGPLVYFDLPGLILEVESKLTSITAIEISQTNAEVEFPVNDLDIISNQEEYRLNKERSEALKKRMKR